MTKVSTEKVGNALALAGMIALPLMVLFVLIQSRRKQDGS